ncbi:TonB-dependent receptor [Bdellovibrio bacteriovorus]|uniref:Putative tonB dependent receptor domain protein n=1 Tax=Bdellovibrio bacteriovorus (strain ATCC 15356 / DSM 50701 / NCIMB 9529 / HD100) TaxID=264462 RepID=Q6MPR1_BDEBA|nr:hypothetical protein [Bdellovibrio bacteriovorus]CAE78736.1 putative tonB dependent receptor domain protein [Bdellovibrio bacteriovorus HD100]
MSILFSFLLTFLLMTVCLPVQAKETDNLTGRTKNLPDSTEIFDREMNKRLQELQAEASSEGISCNDPRKLRILFHDLNDARFFIGSLESWAEDNSQIAKRELTAQQSVYDGVLDNGWIFNRLKLASTVKVNGQLVGTDKFGHFIDQGFEFYTPYRQSGYRMSTALHSSLGSEKGYSGGASTGTISYADAMANYQGILFYHALAEGPNPYFRCSQGKWTQIREFRWADYVDAGWDEGINCSVMASPEAQAKFNANLAKQGQTCPADTSACAQLNTRYAVFDEYILSPECRKVAKAPVGSYGSGKSPAVKSSTGKSGKGTR